MFTSSARRVLPICLLGLLAASPARGDEQLYRKVASSSAQVFKSEGARGSGSGTGFLVDAKERLLVTARHVVENTKGGIVRAVIVIFAESRDGEIITDSEHYRRNWEALAVRGNVIYDSVRRDLAIIQVDKLPAGIKALELAARPARPGQTVHLVGNSLDRLGGVFNYCQGHVRNVFRWEDLGARVVATHLPTNKGDSGGPTVNNLGEVVGVAVMSTTGAAANKTSLFHELQVTGLSICVSEIRDGLNETRQQILASRGPVRPENERKVFLKGLAKAAVHHVQMEKDTMYRILVKAQGFTPDVRIDNVLISAAAGNVVHHLFTPTETKDYVIHLSHLPGSTIGKGPFAYSLSVDQASFEGESELKERPLKLTEHVKRFETGKLYQVTVKGRGFEPDVNIVDGTKTVSSRLNNGNRASSGGATQRFLETVGLAKQEFETSLSFVATRSADHRIVVGVSPYSPPTTGALDYTIHVAEQKLELSLSDQLTAKDPLYPKAGPFKTHTTKFQAGKQYQIDVITTGFDSRVMVQDSAGNVIVHGSDAEGLNSRLFFNPTKTDDYRIVVTAHRIDAIGPYLLTVALRSPGPAGPDAKK